jgi:thiol-disulfide isomerase/thioredoxin
MYLIKMKNTVFCKKLAAVFICLSAGLFCACTDKQSSESPIRYGIAHLTGKVTGTLPFEINENTGKITLITYNSLIRDMPQLQACLQKDGTFALDVPVAYASFSSISSEFYNGFIYLSPNEETKLDVFFDEKEGKHITMVNDGGFTTEEMINFKLEPIWIEIFYGLPSYGSSGILQPEEYSEAVIGKLEILLEKIKTHTELSDAARQYLANLSKIRYLFIYLFDYEDMMRLRYLDTHKDADKNDFTPIIPKKSYYAFLRYFALNNPDYLDLSGESFRLFQTILNDKVLNIPPIGDTPIHDWLKEVKAIIAEYIGADTGLFYDVLVSNAYAKQFEDEMKPLSDKQKENIKKYYKNKAFVEVLFAKDKQIAKFAADLHKPVVNETPAVAKEKLMDAIVSKYKGKVVLVDFWATWCDPCLQAMKESAELKYEMQKKGVVFVYITDPSSPTALWEKKIATIGGEQYYLTKEEEAYLSKQFDFNTIPTYLLFDANGELKHKITGYPGNAEMRKMIEGLLP